MSLVEGWNSDWFQDFKINDVIRVISLMVVSIKLVRGNVGIWCFLMVLFWWLIMVCWLVVWVIMVKYRVRINVVIMKNSWVGFGLKLFFSDSSVRFVIVIGMVIQVFLGCVFLNSRWVSMGMMIIFRLVRNVFLFMFLLWNNLRI